MKQTRHTRIVMMTCIVLATGTFGTASSVRAEDGDGAVKQIPGEPPPGKPDPVLVLWHAYDGAREDIPDWSHHGSIGEFFDGERIPSGRGKAMRLYGEYGKGRCSGYHIMPSDDLKLTEGTVSFWLCVDPDPPSQKRAVILSDIQDGKKHNVAVVDLKNGKYDIAVSFGKKEIRTRGAGIGVNVYHHIAWTFSPTGQTLWIDGENVAQGKTGARLDGTRGLNVGYVSGKKGHRSHGVTGVIDDLRIYNKALSTFPGLTLNPTPPAASPMGVVVDLEFDSGALKNGTSVKDYSGVPHDIVIRGLASDKGPASRLITGDKGSFQFKYDPNGDSTRIRIMPDASFAKDWREGTLEIVFRVRPDPKKVKNEWQLITSNPEIDVTRNPKSRINVFMLDPAENKDEYQTRRLKKTPLCELRFHNGFSFKYRKSNYFFAFDEWVKLVYSWDLISAKVWINDVRVDVKPEDGFYLYKECAICIGSTMLNHGFNGEVSRFRLWNYKRSFYPDEKRADKPIIYSRGAK